MKIKQKTEIKTGPLQIMVLTDHESKLLYDYYEPERMKDIDLIIS